MKKRFMSMLLVLCMVFTLFPSAAFAIGTSSITEGTPLCEKHKEHDADCGYIEAKDEKPCSHLNEDGSYSCAPVLDSGVSGNVATPGDAEQSYVCDHSDGCGFAEAVEGAPCTHECELCKTEKPTAPKCDCTVKCTSADAENAIEESINPDCPVCCAEGADLAQCKGEAPMLLMSPRSTSQITATLNLTSVASDVKCTDSDVGTKITGHTQHTHADSTPCWAWNNTNHKLTLNNVDIEASGGSEENKNGIELPNAAVTVLFSGSNTVSGVLNSNLSSNGITNDRGSITLTGATADATLNAGGTSYGISATTTQSDSITITEGKVNASGDYGAIAGQSVNISGGTVVATTTTTSEYGAAIWGGHTITLSGGTVTAKTGGGKAKAFRLEPTLTGMRLKAGSAAWDNITGAACIYEVDTPASSTKITSTLDLTSVASDVKCTDSDVASKITGHTPHTHADNTPCWAWNNTNHKLTLNDVDIDTSGGSEENTHGIELPNAAVTILFSGSNAVSGAVDTTPKSYGILNQNGSTILTGTTANAALKAIGGTNGNGISAPNEKLTINQGNIDASGGGYGLSGQGVTIEDGTVKATGGTYEAIWGGNDGIALSGGTVTAQTSVGKKPFHTEPNLSNGMKLKEGSAAWDNITGAACIYEVDTLTSHTVTLNASGGSVSPTSLTVTAGSTAALPTPSRSGSYRFDGWFTAASGGTQYTSSTTIDSNVTLYAHWTYTGGGSTGGVSSSGGSAPAAPPSNTINYAEGSKGTTNVVSTAIKDAIAAGTGGGIATRTTFNSFDFLALEGLKVINEIVAKESAGKTVSFKVNFDAGPKNHVTSRITVAPAALAKVMTEKLPLGVYFDQQKDAKVQAVNELFEKSFNNKIVSVVYDQRSPLAVNAELCAKLNLATTFGQGKQLYFYTYDNEKCRYNRIANPGYWVDKNGYAHINAPLGGSIIISDAPLTKK